MTMQALFAQSQTLIPFSGIAAFDEPMSRHTTFNIGGPADLYLKPAAACFVPYTTALLRLARARAVPVFILGGGANLLVADKGIRGIVLDTGSWTGVIKIPRGGTPNAARETGTDAVLGAFLPLLRLLRLLRHGAQKVSKQINATGPRSTPEGVKDTPPPIPAPAGNGTPAAAVHVRFRAGTPTDDAVCWAAANGLSGLEDFAGLPGTIGGAVWMNARCYDRSISSLLVETACLDEHLELITAPIDPAAFAYKKSPFQGRDNVILEAVFSLNPCAPGTSALVAEKTAARRAEREAKGHFRYPSAGSIFKNNRDFGKPAGKIIEELGLRGLQIGGAQIAPWHGNFIINTGGATATDVQRLITLIEEKARQTLGIELEREVIYAG